MKRIYYPLLALALGVIGFFLRMQQLSAALSPSTGMPILFLRPHRPDGHRHPAALLPELFRGQ